MTAGARTPLPSGRMPTFRTTDDVTLAYTDEGQGRPVVLVHGYTAPATAWVLTVDALLAAGYRAIAFDRRAHGESETPGPRAADGAPRPRPR